MEYDNLNRINVNQNLEDYKNLKKGNKNMNYFDPQKTMIITTELSIFSPLLRKPYFFATILSYTM